jgi:hypothetical protein
VELTLAVHRNFYTGKRLTHPPESSLARQGLREGEERLGHSVAFEDRY